MASMNISACALGKADEQGKKRRVRMKAQDFIARYMQHVLPTGLKRIRHYGVLANPCTAKLAQAKAALHMPAGNRAAQDNAQDFMARVAKVNISQCPACEQAQTQMQTGRPAANSRAPPQSCVP